MTFVAFSIYPMLYLLAKVLRRRHLKTFTMLGLFLSIGGLIGGLSMIYLDHLFYSSFHTRSVTHRGSGREEESTKWPLTPLNFILYNGDTKKLEQHGTHPWYLHLTVNMMLLFAPLYMVFVTRVAKMICKKLQYSESIATNCVEDNNSRSKENFFIIALVVPLMVLSLIPHQEPRYLVPLLVPLLAVVVPRLHASHNRDKLLKVWIAFNIVCGVWFGFLHQGGVYKSLEHMNQHIHSTRASGEEGGVHLIYWRTHMAPPHLLGVDVNDNTVRLHNLNGGDCQRVTDLLQDLRRKNFSGEVWLFCPSVLHSSVGDNFTLHKQYFPHVTTEDLPHWGAVGNRTWDRSSYWDYFTQIIVDSFSLNAYHLSM